MPPAMNQLREAVSIPVESRTSPRTPRRSSRSPQTEHKPNAMNPAYMLTMARPIASNLSTVPSDASPQLRPSCTRALNRAADTPAHVLALIGAGACFGLPPWLWPCRWSGRPPRDAGPAPGRSGAPAVSRRAIFPATRRGRGVREGAQDPQTMELRGCCGSVGSACPVLTVSRKINRPCWQDPGQSVCRRHPHLTAPHYGAASWCFGRGKSAAAR